VTDTEARAFLAAYGAGQGIGLAFARALAARGLDLLLVDVDGERLAAAAGSLGAGGKVATACIDLAATDAGDVLARALAGHEIGLGVVTAVRSLVGPFLDERLEALAASVDVNCRGVLVAAHVLGRALRDRGRGGLILLSSLAGLQGTGGVAAYAAAKAFDAVLAESLWWELAPHGVDVVALLAGATDTPGFRAHGPRSDDPMAFGSADAVAEEGLAALGHGPRAIAGEANRRTVAALARLPRDEIVRLTSEGTRRLYERD